jgi:hypothetical protein
MITMLHIVPILALISSLALAGCSSNDNGDPNTAATCAAICARQNELCGTSTNCNSLCESLSELASTTGCTAENQAGLDCLAEKDVCDTMSTVCPADDLDRCVDTYCQANAAASVCQ